MKEMGKVGILVALLACAPALQAAEGPDITADEVLAAAAAGDGAAMRALAALDDPDPWVVVDVLLGAGERKVAEAFAAAAPRETTRRLPEYVRAWSPRESEEAVRSELAAATVSHDAASSLTRLEALGRSPDDALEVRIHLARGHALRATHVLLGSAGAFEHAAEIAGRLGWRAAEADALYQAGNSLYMKGSFEDAAEVFRRRLAVERALRNQIGMARGHYGLALALTHMTRTAASKRHMQLAGKLAAAAGDHEYLAKLVGSEAFARARAGLYLESLQGYEEALLELEQVGERPVAARFRASPLRLARQRSSLLLNASSMAGQLERWNDFERYGREAMEVAAQLGDERLRLEAEAQYVTAQGERHRLEGNDLELEEALERALANQRKLGDRPEEADLLRRIAQALLQRCDAVGALDRLNEAEAILQETGALRLLPRVLLERGISLTILGEYESAHEQLMTALDLAAEYELPLVRLDTLIELGSHHMTRGEHAEALRWFGEVDALELPPDVPRQDGTRAWHLARLYGRLGDEERALALFQRALDEKKGPGRAKFVRKVRRSMIAMQVGRGEYGAAQTALEADLELALESKDAFSAADSLSLLGHLAYRQDRKKDARTYWLRTEEIYQELNNPLWLARVWLNLARLHIWEGDDFEAQRRLDQTLAAAEKLQLAHFLAQTYGIQALAHLQTGKVEEARRWARRGVDQAVFVGRRLAEGEGAAVRTGHVELHETGAIASARSGHAEDLLFFLEGGRAATLLESLDGGRALRADAVPTELRREESTARTAEVRALAAYRRAVRDGKLEMIQQSRADLDAARGRLRKVVLDIQRKARVQGSRILPRPVALATLRAGLAPGEALVLYGLTAKRPVALVIERDGERIVGLGAVDALQAEVDALLTNESPFVRPEAVDALAQRLLGKLELDEKVTRLVVSPEGVIARVPFGLLAPEHEVVLVPSASTWSVLETRPVERGRRVLAYGDPAYAEGQAGLAPARLRRGGGLELLPLPATAEEAQAVGDVIRVHAEATETRLREDLATGDRWRAVHLACHGLLDVDRPALSSLALSTDETHDGYLTALDVYRMRISTDLAVLSACETGRGRNVGGEGLFGLPRAFLYAGASSVLVSLWPVDDDATQALMTHFYELWSPVGEGAEPVAAATALRQAQAWLRTQTRWKHPRFWSGWVLWGKAD